MMTAAPIWIPFAAMLLFIISGEKRNLYKFIAVVFSLILCLVSATILIKVVREGILVSYAGGWKAPFGISIVIDRLSAVMLLIASILVLSITLYAVSESKNNSRFFLLLAGIIMGINGIFITGDIFNMYVWFELMLIASFVLLGMGNHKGQYEGGVKYLSINLLGSFFLLTGIGLLYGYSGTLNLAHLSMKFRDIPLPPEVNLSLAFIIISFSIKAAFFPFFFWLPSSYHTPPAVVSALFAGLLTKVGVYALIRIFTLFFWKYDPFWNNLILVIAGFTMITGAVASFSQTDTRRLLSFSIVSQMGYLAMGLAFYTPLALAATIYFMLHNSLAKTNLFLISGIIAEADGSYEMKRSGGWYKRSPALSVLFLISGLALAGIPPLPGFFGKFLLALAGYSGGHYLITSLSIFVALITLSYIIRYWNNIFRKEDINNTDDKQTRISFQMLFPSVLLSFFIICLGFGAGFFFEFLHETADQLLNPSEYIGKVLGSFNGI